MLPLNEAEQQFLLRLARTALEQAVRYGCPYEGEHAGGILREGRGAFVTLRKAGSLRGCIGQIETRSPLHRTVPECAFAAALRDPRFPPVTPDELRDLRIEISILSRLKEILPEEIEVGRHGLLVSLGLQRGLLLPQVAVQWKWDRERFLEETCHKAGLPGDAWRHHAKIRAFTTQVFAEPDDSPQLSVPPAGEDKLIA